ncbi:MAG TPA: hypothetical protein VE732_06405 [Nitrososphaera sp.]|jgi:hypothetical protein|nr:hypothetical protein [Nitrososphaera sp.]
MKLYLPRLSCGQCSGELSSQDDALIIEITDSNHYQATCPQGHLATISIQANKFEILFEMGAVALLEGYYREAVANLAGALERFMEFYVSVMMIKAGINEKEFNETWKLVSNQSERQLGAFAFVYLNENKQPPKYLSNNAINFRNNVIHKGYIPTYQEVCKYGQAVLSFIDPIFEGLKNNEEDWQYVLTLLRRNYSKLPNLTNTVGLLTTITMSYHKYFTGERDFQKEMEDIPRKWAGSLGGPFYGVRGYISENKPVTK